MSIVHLVDGTYELFRCFHGAPRATDAEGHEIGAVRGLLWTLTKMLRKEDGTHVAVAFDLMAPPDKRDRSDDTLLRSQARLAMDVARTLGLVVWPAVRNQADDVLASAATHLAGKVDQVRICTSDKDLLQCVRGTDVVLHDRVRDRFTNQATLLERFGVRPQQIPDRSALVGDPSDGLPGVKGWGTRSAAAVLGTYARLEDIPLDVSMWTCRVRGAARLRDALSERWEEALIVRALATLRTDLPIRPSVESLRWQGPTDDLPSLCERLDSRELLDKLDVLRTERAP